MRIATIQPSPVSGDTVRTRHSHHLPRSLVPVAVSVMTAVVQGATRQSSGSLFTETSYGLDSTSFPVHATLVDVNNDQWTDIATANAGNGSVSVLLNSGQGVVTLLGSFQTGSAPVWIDDGDLDGNGTIDLVTAHASSISVLQGDGQGAFTMIGNVPSSNILISVHLGDIDQDGHVDLVTLEHGWPEISLRLGNGDGTFEAPSPCVATGGWFPTAATLVDLTNDGDLDFAMVFRQWNWAYGNVKLGTGGSSTFSCYFGPNFGGSSPPYAISSGDLNADGFEDLVVAGHGASVTGDVAFLLGNGSGYFGSPSSVTFVGSYPHSAAVADLDGDGNKDVALGNISGNSLTLVRGNGAGGATGAIDIPVVSPPYSVGCVDLNSDGLIDMVTANPATDNVSVFLNQAVFLRGHVLFKDNLTPVASSSVFVSVQLYSHPNHQLVHTATATVKIHDGSFVLPVTGLSAGEYDILAVASIPGLSGQFWHGSAQEAQVCQPFDLDPGADLVISPAGVPSLATFEFRFPWPVILLSGYVPTCWSSGFCNRTGQFDVLQPHLASNPTLALTTPRDAVLPVLPRLRGKSLTAAYNSLRSQLARIFSSFSAGTQFQVVGYSQGGLLARKLLYNPVAVGRINRVIQLGTPNAGSCVADAHCLFSCTGFPLCLPSVCPLTLANMIGFNASTVGGGGVPFHLVAGTSYSPHPNVDNSCLSSEPSGSDGFVSVDSVNALGALSYNIIGQTTLVPAAHEELPRFQGVLDMVQLWLNQ